MHVWKTWMSDWVWPLFPKREMDVCIDKALYTEGSVQGMPPHACPDSFLVPYSQISLQDQQEILICLESRQHPMKVMLRNFLIDESNIKYIVRQFRKHWKQRLFAIGASLSEGLTVPCLSAYSRQFMQVHRTRNILFAHQHNLNCKAWCSFVYFHQPVFIDNRKEH